MPFDPLRKSCFLEADILANSMAGSGQSYLLLYYLKCLVPWLLVTTNMWFSKNLERERQKAKIQEHEVTFCLTNLQELDEWSRWLRRGPWRAWQSPSPNPFLVRNIDSDTAPIPGVLEIKFANSEKIPCLSKRCETICHVTLPPKGLNIYSLLLLSEFFQWQKSFLFEYSQVAKVNIFFSLVREK